MIDVLDEVYKRLLEDDFIRLTCEDRIKYYTIPETLNINKPFMLISFLEPTREVVYRSDIPSVESVELQIDVEGSDRKVVKEIQHHVRNVLKKMNLKQEIGGLDTYFDETKRFVDSRRYSGLPFNLYKEEY